MWRRSFFTVSSLVICALILPAVTATEMNDYQETILTLHNTYRQKHNVSTLVWDEAAAAFATNWCSKLLRNSSLRHSEDFAYGENIYLSQTTGQYREKAVMRKMRQSVKKWYGEAKFYDYDNPKFALKSGHFTQVVWAATQRVGCGYAFSEKLFYVCCNYSPPGNYGRRMEENVLPPTA